MRLDHNHWVTAWHYHWSVHGPHGVVEYRRATGFWSEPKGSGLVVLHHARCWAGCVTAEHLDPCPGGPDDVAPAMAVHTGYPPELATLATVLGDADDATVWSELDALYQRVMPDPDAALSVPVELPPSPDPGLAARLRDTPFGP